GPARGLAGAEESQGARRRRREARDELAARGEEGTQEGRVPRELGEVAPPEPVDEHDDGPLRGAETQPRPGRGVLRAGSRPERVGEGGQDETEVRGVVARRTQPRRLEASLESRHPAAVAAESARATSTAACTAPGPSASPLTRSTRSSRSTVPE